MRSAGESSNIDMNPTAPPSFAAFEENPANELDGGRDDGLKEGARERSSKIFSPNLNQMATRYIYIDKYETNGEDHETNREANPEWEESVGGVSNMERKPTAPLAFASCDEEGSISIAAASPDAVIITTVPFLPLNHAFESQSLNDLEYSILPGPNFSRISECSLNPFLWEARGCF